MVSNEDDLAPRATALKRLVHGARPIREKVYVRAADNLIVLDEQFDALERFEALLVEFWVDASEVELRHGHGKAAVAVLEQAALVAAR